jgi:hypothetical protein
MKHRILFYPSLATAAYVWRKEKKDQKAQDEPVNEHVNEQTPLLSQEV